MYFFRSICTSKILCEIPPEVKSRLGAFLRGIMRGPGEGVWGPCANFNNGSVLQPGHMNCPGPQNNARGVKRPLVKQSFRLCLSDSHQILAFSTSFLSAPSSAATCLELFQRPPILSPLGLPAISRQNQPHIFIYKIFRSRQSLFLNSSHHPHLKQSSSHKVSTLSLPRRPHPPLNKASPLLFIWFRVCRHHR